MTQVIFATDIFRRGSSVAAARHGVAGDLAGGGFPIELFNEI